VLVVLYFALGFNIGCYFFQIHHSDIFGLKMGWSCIAVRVAHVVRIAVDLCLLIVIVICYCLLLLYCLEGLLVCCWFFFFSFFFLSFPSSIFLSSIPVSNVDPIGLEI